MNKKNVSGKTKKVVARAPKSQTEELKEKLLVELTKIPIVEVACKRVGIGRSTYYAWRTADSEFSKLSDRALYEGRQSISDLAESRLIKNIQDGNNTSIIFWLKNNDQRYTDKRLYEHIIQEEFPMDDRDVKNLIKGLYFNFSDMSKENEAMLQRFFDSDVPKETIANALTEVIDEHKESVERIVNKNNDPDYENLIEEAKDLLDKIEKKKMHN